MREIHPAYLLLIPAVWCVVSFLMSRISGWHRLARRYPDQPVRGDVARMRSGKIGGISYYSCLTFRASEQGLRVSVALPFRIGHRPFYIPWDEFHDIKHDTVMYSQKVCMTIGKPTLSRVTFPGWVKYYLPYSMRPK
ncbi:MAG: hypothetical protein MI861_06305 [Pirellulales bacterium]|nr:hypothetical protein [Pirellulales bacterium]